MDITDEQVDAALAENVARGFLVVNEDGSYSMTDAGKEYAETKMGMVTIPRAQYEALMALTTASQNAWELLRYQPRDLPCETETAAKLLEHALAALRAAGFDMEEKT